MGHPREGTRGAPDAPLTRLSHADPENAYSAAPAQAAYCTWCSGGEPVPPARTDLQALQDHRLPPVALSMPLACSELCAHGPAMSGTMMENVRAGHRV